MEKEYLGVVTGLSDLINFLAALQKHTRQSVDKISSVKAILFGQAISLPQALQNEFFDVAARAFPFLKTLMAPLERVSADGFDADGYAPPPHFEKNGPRTVFANGVHKPFHQSFLTYLSPDEVCFFDNGLSSYAPHAANVEAHFTARGLPAIHKAYLTLHPPLPIPPYLSSAKASSLPLDVFVDIYATIRSAAPEINWLPEHVILGTSLFRTKRISWDDERETYLRLIDHIRTKHDSEILFKAHPRALDRPLITDTDGVIVMENSAPVEAFARHGLPGTAYSISSTALITLPAQFGWTSYRLKTEKTEALLDKSPHLSMVRFVKAISV